MKKYTLPILALGLSFCLFAFAAIAQTDPSPAADPLAAVPVDIFLQALLASIGGLKGAGGLAIAGAVVQLIVMLAKLDILGGLWAKIGGIWKLVVVLSLSYVSGVLSLVASGVSIGAALIHSTTLSALMVLGNELYKHFAEKKA
jgi:hypothetical protein